MGFIELLLLAVGLSMDAFAVSICKGLGMKELNLKHAVIIALFFGLFQAGMPIIGWLLGSQFEQFITPFDHWIAFGLLAFLGAKMLVDVFRGEGECDCEGESGQELRLNLKELVMLAVATSIDALAVGITFAFLGVDIVFSVVAIGVTTFVFSFVCVAVGNRFGGHFEKAAQVAGGVVLMLIGLKILFEHMGIISF